MRMILLALVGCLTICARPVSAQAPPRPGPEHEKLKHFAGEWDAAVKFGGMEVKGTATYKMGVGGFWLLGDFRADFGGLPFEGKSQQGYDPLKKKYVTTWIDSMGPSMLVMEGLFDKDGKTYTETGEGPGMDGKLRKFRSVYEWKDKDTIVFQMYETADGKEQQTLKITYTRKK
jgi:hypothetical protein